MKIDVLGYALVPPAPTNLEAAPGDGNVLDGTGSLNPDGDTLRYTWTQTVPASGTESALELSDTTVASPTFAAPTQLLNDVTLTFSLTVDDETNTSTADTVAVTVIA